MAVYTELAFEDCAGLLQRLGLGALRELRGIASGIENTNYFATTDAGEWVVTLFERLPRDELPYYLRLMRHLAQQGLPVPWPQGPATEDDTPEGLVHTLSGKPAAVVTRLPGTSVMQPGVHHAAELGRFLGRMHREAARFAGRQAHARGLVWWRETLPAVLPHVDAATAALLNDELAVQEAFARSPAGQALPRGHLHADLFRDNALFEGPGPVAGGHTPRLSGVLDFYFAGVDVLAFDVAVCLNDWCLQDGHEQLHPERSRALLQAYQAERPWQPGEREALPLMLRAAALRFWISRLWDWHLPRSAALLTPKDPAHFERVLRARRDNPVLPDF